MCTQLTVLLVGMLSLAASSDYQGHLCAQLDSVLSELAATCVDGFDWSGTPTAHTLVHHYDIRAVETHCIAMPVPL